MLGYLLIEGIAAHSWVDEILLVADNGSFLYPGGTPRSFGQHDPVRLMRAGRVLNNTASP